jgi:hypothetical protein
MPGTMRTKLRIGTRELVVVVVVQRVIGVLEE